MITLGGDAELELVDSLDPFSEGVVFSVRPPKKSWKNIANLSGGEKVFFHTCVSECQVHSIVLWIKMTCRKTLQNLPFSMEFYKLDEKLIYTKVRIGSLIYENGLYQLCSMKNWP